MSNNSRREQTNTQKTIKPSNHTTMSKKVNKKRQAYAEKQQKQGQNVVKWIFVALLLLAIVYVAFTMTTMN